MNTPNEKQPSKSSSCDASNSQSGVEKSQKISGYPQPENEAEKLHLNDKINTLCSDTWISLAESEDLPWQQSNWGEYRQLSLWKSTPTLKQSCDITSQEYQFTQTSETTTQTQESSTLLAVDSRVREHQTQEVERDSNIQPQHSGEKDLDVSLKPNPSSVLWNNLKELSDEDFELFLADSLWQDTVLKLKQSRQQALALGNKDSDYLSFPTLTSNVSSTSRPAGQTKCDRWFKDNGLIQPGYQLSAQAIAMIMGFPPNWFDCLSPTERQEEFIADISQEEQLHQDKQRSPSEESSTSQKLLGGDEKLLEHKRGERSSQDRELSIPCLVKQPKQSEAKGVIRKDEGDRFLVDVNGEEISVSKLFVYPDLDNCSSKKCKTASAKPKQKVLDTSDKCSSKTIPPSTKSSSKTRRLKGEGSGHIYYRTVTRNGKDYRQAYYQWRENGRQRTRYIPKKLLVMVQEAESRKLTVADILNLLGEKQKCSSKSSDKWVAVSFRTLSAEVDEKVPNRSVKCSSKIESPSKSQRRRGEGSGSIYWRTIKKNGKEYKQTYYHYEIWEKGDRLIKSCEYIPKRMRSQIERMNNEKAPVEEILKVLRNRSKSQKC